MTAPLPQAARALVDAPNFGVLGCSEPDGSPHLSVVWVTAEGDDVLVSTTIGRRKQVNLARDPRASLLVYGRDDGYRYAELRGRVTMTEAGGRELIDELSNKYAGRDYDREPDGTRRVVVRLSPEKVIVRG